MTKVARASKRKRAARVCLTEGAIYRTTIAPRSITVTVECPAQIDLCARDEQEHIHGTLESRVHDAMEWVLGPWFYHAMHERRTELIQKTGWPDFHLTPDETAELAKLDARVDELAAFSETPADNEIMMFLRKEAKRMRQDIAAGITPEALEAEGK